MPNWKPGRKGWAYYNTGTFGSPVWAPIKGIRDLTRTGGTVSIDVATRETDAVATGVVGRDRGLSFQLLRQTSQASYLAIENAYDTDDATLDVLSLDGPVATTGSRGVRAIMQVTKFDEPEPLVEKMTVDVEMKPTQSDDLPSPVRWVS